MAFTPSPTKRITWLTDSLLLAVAIAVFYFYCLGTYPLFTPDEGRYAEVAREMLTSGDFVTPRVNGVVFLDKPVLYYWLQALSMHSFGVNEWAIRFFPALFGLLGSLAVYFGGRYVFDRRAGILSALILATSPLYFCCAHYANLDLEVAVLITCTLLLFLAGTTTEGRKRSWFFIAAYVVAALAFLTKGLIGLVFPIMIIGLWMLLLSKWRLLLSMRVITGFIVIALIVTPWLVLVQRDNPEFLHYFFVTQQFTRFLSHATFNNPSPFWFYLPIVIAGFFPWTAFLPAAFYASSEQMESTLFLKIWALMIFVFFSIPHSKTISYILPVLPPLALLCGKYLSDAWEEKNVTHYATSTLLVLLFTAIAALFFLAPTHWYDMPPRLIPIFMLAGLQLGIAALLLVFCMRRGGVRYPFYICAITVSLMLATLITNAKVMNPNSAKPAIETLQLVLKPGDTVVNYFKFFQDAPIYLQRTVLLVANWESPTIAERDNWVREMWYSMPYQQTDGILLTEKTFWQRWHSKERMYVFINQNYFKQFTAHTEKYYWLTQYHDIIIVSNHPIWQK